MLFKFNESTVMERSIRIKYLTRNNKDITYNIKYIVNKKNTHIFLYQVTPI